MMRALCVAVAISLGSIGAAQAASVTFGDWTFNEKPKSVLPTVTAEDTGVPGEVKFTIGLAGASTHVGTLTGFFFDALGFSHTSSFFPPGSVADAFEEIRFNTNNAGNGANLNGDIDDMTAGTQVSGGFSYAVRFDKLSVSPTAAKFFVKGAGFDAGDLFRVGLRFQEVGIGGLGGWSNKIVGTVVNTPPDSTIPLPAGGWLLLSGLGLLALRRFTATA